jgi:hypothetical protein
MLTDEAGEALNGGYGTPKEQLSQRAGFRAGPEVTGGAKAIRRGRIQESLIGAEASESAPYPWNPRLRRPLPRVSKLKDSRTWGSLNEPPFYCVTSEMAIMGCE